MLRGKRYGDRPSRWRLGFGIQTFIREDGGYTTVAVAAALLVSLTLVFGTAAAQWTLARSADVQEVADATAMAGENCVASFTTVAQALDACVLTMGLTGVVICGAGLVVAAIPPLEAQSAAIMNAGRKVLDARRSFAKTASKGLGKLEEALPALILANSASCASANSTGGLQYVGAAVPFPQKSQSNFSSLEDDVDADDMVEDAEELSEASKRKEEAHQRAEAAKERAWRADNVDNPMCMRSRAATLSGLDGSLNPFYPTKDVWTFEYARVRARNYYGVRYSQERIGGSNTDELQRSCARKQFYGYCYEAVGLMSCIDTEDRVEMNLDEVPHNGDMVRDTRLYTDVVWPCTCNEYGEIILHCSLSCPAAIDPYVGNAALWEVDDGWVYRCEECLMDVRAMGNVANASTNINNGFEHYWRIVVDASKEYEAARADEIAAEKEMQKEAEKGKDAFDKAMEMLSVDRPKLCPPGAWGCVSAVMRPGATSTPTELTSAFVAGSELPRGVAISAAVLAPDNATERNTVLARAFDGLRGGGHSFALDLVGSVTGLWSDLLVGYGSAYGDLSNIAERFLGGVEGVFGQRVATWLRGKLKGLISATGFEPADLRLRKPVLVNSQTVLDKAGLTKVGKARELVETFPSNPDELVAFARSQVADLLGTGPFTIAEVPVPGLEGVSIPLTVDLSKLGVS